MELSAGGRLAVLGAALATCHACRARTGEFRYHAGWLGVRTGELRTRS